MESNEGDRIGVVEDQLRELKVMIDNLASSVKDLTSAVAGALASAAASRASSCDGGSDRWRMRGGPQDMGKSRRWAEAGKVIDFSE